MSVLSAIGLLLGCTGTPAGSVGEVARAAGMDPDLVVRVVSGPPSATPWTSIEVTVEVCNQGGAWAQPSAVAVVTSDDGVIDALDPLLATVQVGDLVPGGCSRVTAIGPSPGVFGRHVLGAIADRDQYVLEGDEANNATAGNTLAVGHDPDLVVERMRGPVTAMPGAPITVAVRVCNRGQAWTPGTGVEIYLSADTEITPSDPSIGSIYTSDLAPGACDDRSTMAPAWGDPGAHVLGAIVDPYQSIAELDEDNNARAGAALHLGWDPDLVVTAIDGPASARPGSDVPVAVTVCNQGQATSSDTTVEVHVSEDDALDPMNDPRVGFASIPALQPGRCATGRLPASMYYLPEGAYRLVAVVDPWSSLVEIVEDNNVRIGAPFGLGHGPDLVVTAVTGPHAWWPYEDFQATARICNQGQGASPGTSVRIYASVDGLRLPGQMYPNLTWVPELAPGACASATGPVFAPGTPGAYVLGADVDPEGFVVELIEGNNAGAGQPIAIGHDAELVVTSVTPPPGTLPPNGPALVIARVCNHGRVSAEGALVDVRVSRDVEPSGDDMPAGQGQSPWLPPDTCADVAVNAYVSAPEKGAYFFVATVDPFDAVVEILDDNNAAASDAVGIGYDADLVVTAIAAPPSAMPGASMAVAVTVCNRGQTYSSYTEVEVTAWGESPGSSVFGTFLGQAPIFDLAPGRCTTARLPASISEPPGVYRISAVVDRWDNVSEILEDNNERQGGVVGVGYDADLVVAGVSGPRSWWPSQEFQATARICNQGQGMSPSTSVRLYASNDGLSLPGQPYPGQAWVPDLAPGACVNVTGPVLAPSQPGGYVLGAAVDPEGWVPELIESNNAGAGQGIAIGHDADLVITAVVPPAGTLPPGGQAVVSARVCNHGRAPSGDAPVALRLSRDAVLSGDDMPVGQGQAPWLEPDACADVPIDAYVSVPEQGGYVFLAEVDPQRYVIEILDDNNTAASDVVGIGWSPDLVVTAIVAPPSAMPSTSFELAVTVCNRGQMNSSYTEVEVTAAGESPTAPMFESFLGAVSVGHLEPGQCATSLMPASIGAYGAHRLRAVIDRWNHVSEILEDNNDFEGGVIGVGYDADLVVTGVSGPRSWWPYQEFEATARICNQGQGPSPGTNVRLYVSDDGLSAPGQPYPAPTWVPELAPGACTSVTGPVFAQGAPGGYVLGAAVDPEGWVPELIENNNAGAGQRIAIGHDADLVVTAVVPPPGTLPPSGQAVVIARVCNHGRMMSSDALVELRLSRDAALSGDDMPVGQGQAPWLEPDACADVPVTASYAAPGQGAYRFLAEVDPQKYVIEILDDNNTAASDVVGIGYDADLVVTSIVAPPSALPGAAIELAVTVCNRGQMSSSGTEVEVRASAESPAAPMFEVFLGAAPVAYLPPGQCATSLVPASLDGVYGGYRLRAVIDRWNHVSEILEGNNGFQGGVIGVGYDADLVVTAVDGPPSALPGAPLGLTVRVCNQGQGPSAGAPIEVYFSDDDEIGLPSDMPAGWGQVDGLAPAACADVLVSAYAPGRPGAYVPGAIADPQRYVPELIENNNARAGERIGIGYEPDLVVAQVGGPASVQPWTELAVTARVCNQGQSPSSGATLHVVLSADAEVGSGDLLMGGVPVPTLEPGACHDLLATVMAQVAPGAYTLGAIVRADGASELLADNNGRAGGLLGVGHEPDLTVTAVTGPASAPVNGEIALGVEACNQGQSASFATMIDVVLSSDAAIDASDIPVGSAWLDPLAPGACRTVSVPAYPFQPAGRYALGARVDPQGNNPELIESNNAAAGASIELTPY